MKAILIDDEQLALDFLERQLTKIEEITVLGSYTNPKKGVQAILNEDVDVVFLDIHLPSTDGVKVARHILAKKPTMLIVFVTAFSDYAVDAFELNAADYLVKPIQFERLEETVERVKQKIARRNAKIEQEEHEKLRIIMSKQFSIEKDGQPLRRLSWRTARVKELYLFLLQHRNKVVHKELIAELLWSEVDLDKAFAQLYTTIYHIRNVLKDFGDHFTLDNATSGYILYVQHVEIDVQVWEEALGTLPPLHTDTYEDYTRVMDLYSAPYLQDHNYSWTISEAERLDQMWIMKALDIGRFLENEGRDKEAYEWHAKICTRYPSVEEAHLAVMKQLAKERKSLLVHQQYATLKHVLEEELGLEPSAYVTKWYEDWEQKDRLNV